MVALHLGEQTQPVAAEVIQSSAHGTTAAGLQGVPGGATSSMQQRTRSQVAAGRITGAPSNSRPADSLISGRKRTQEQAEVQSNATQHEAGKRADGKRTVQPPRRYHD